MGTGMTAFPLPSPGTVVAGDFRVVRALKEGGMGAVYVAEQMSTGARRALKLLHPQYVQDDAMRRRFEQEARAAARIESDYVVEVIGAGVDAPTGMPWIAMELLDGEDLGDHVARVGKLGAAETLDVMRMLCHAVAAAHDAGIVHRDLKPENVFLARSRRPGEAFTLKVLDFGIARTADALSTGTAALGTPLWMAPEQTTRGPKILPPTDVWAIGLIAFYLLTGSWYWRTAHGEEASITAFLRELTLDPIDPASVRAADLGLGSLPDGFDGWFDRCVRREPSERFENARAAFAALEPVLAGAAAHREQALAGTVPVDEAVAAEAAGPRPARPFFVRSETERALAAGKVPALAVAAPPPAAVVPAAAPLPPVTAEGTTVTRPIESAPPGRPARRWPAVLFVLALAAGGGTWLWTNRRTQHAAVDAAQQTARESPMVALPGALFALGSDAGAVDERPLHEVSFPAFQMQIDEVTVAQYERCVAAGVCSPAGTDAHCNAGSPGRERNPINCVSEPQAEAYCAWLGRRLPSEEEWEFAAAGKGKRLFAWGDATPDGRACWKRGDGGTCDVGSLPGATPEGLHDMTGNVWEWTSSDYCSYDPSQRCAHDQKVTRGGGWADADANLVRATVRQQYAPATQSTNVGFRCARSV